MIRVTQLQRKIWDPSGKEMPLQQYLATLPAKGMQELRSRHPIRTAGADGAVDDFVWGVDHARPEAEKLLPAGTETRTDCHVGGMGTGSKRA